MSDVFPPGITIGKKYGPAMEIEDQAMADAYFDLCVEHTMRVAGIGHAAAESIERSNLGYYAGYYSTETRARVERLFKCSHPYFGAIAQVGAPDPDKLFEMGMDLARLRASQ